MVAFLLSLGPSFSAALLGYNFFVIRALVVLFTPLVFLCSWTSTTTTTVQPARTRRNGFSIHFLQS